MKLIIHLLLLEICLILVDSLLISKSKDNLLRYFDEPKKNPNDGLEYNSARKSGAKRKLQKLRADHSDNPSYENYRKNGYDWEMKYNLKDDEVKPKYALREGSSLDELDKDKAKSKMKYLKKFRKEDEMAAVSLTPSPDWTAPKVGKGYFHMDPVLNALRRQPNYRSQNFKTLVDFRRDGDTASSLSSQSSSSREMKDFKDEFRELWMHKKFEALNKSLPRGDIVNMVAARPWGVPCGDPNQHDMPWGTCMLAMECEPEFRVYRGDSFCGRTQFVCCSLQLTTYDTYQGFDISFDDKSMTTDSDEMRNRDKTSKEKSKSRKAKEKKRRKNARERRKKKIKRHIKKIIKEITKILNKQYRNGTRQRKKRTKQLKKFIKDLKKQYKKDRQSVKDLHENEMVTIDKALMDRLKQIQKVNNNFASNSTFRNVIMNGTITKKAARMLLEAYPELDEFLETRRTGGGDVEREGQNDAKQGSDNQMLEYDVEYGYLYY